MQLNVNHAREAQDLLVHNILAGGFDLAVIAETYCVPVHLNSWIGSTDGKAAMVAMGTKVFSGVLFRSDGFVATAWDDLIVCSCYFTPSALVAAFDEWLNELHRELLNYRGKKLLIMGDVNTWATKWGSPRISPRGRRFLEWAMSLDLCLLNRRNVATFAGPKGTSIVDVAWASPEVTALIEDWRVDVDSETLSDHRYISIVYDGGLADVPTVMRLGRGKFRAWKTRQIDPEAFLKVVETAL